MNRPLDQLFWPELRTIAYESWSDPSILQLVLAELLFRNRQGARVLREELSERLRVLSEQSFHWPSTAVLPSSQALADDQFWYTQGLLSFMGYHVGLKGVRDENRRDILDYVYSGKLPRVNSEDYMVEWGEPTTCQRLRKIAESLAAFARNAKRNKTADMQNAIIDWEADLHYLYHEYYIKVKCNFFWPITT